MKLCCHLIFQMFNFYSLLILCFVFGVRGEAGAVSSILPNLGTSEFPKGACLLDCPDISVHKRLARTSAYPGNKYSDDCMPEVVIAIYTCDSQRRKSETLS